MFQIISKDAFGATIAVPEGTVAEIEANAIIRDEGRAGLTIRVAGGGILSVRMSSGAVDAMNRTRYLAYDFTDSATRSKIEAALQLFRTTRMNRNAICDKLGIPFGLFSAACDLRADATRPPYRGEYEAAIRLRRNLPLGA